MVYHRAEMYTSCDQILSTINIFIPQYNKNILPVATEDVVNVT